jgi:heme exporter protein A
MTLTQQPPVRAPVASTSSAPQLAMVDLACRRGTRLLFKGLSLAVEPGQIAWLRGQNGRGKTSLLRLAAGLSTPDHGQILVGGTPARHAASGHPMLFLAHANALKDDLSAAEALAFLLRLHGGPCDRESVHGALERVGLHSRRDAMVRTLSQGQRRRVALARLAAEQRASLWLLDEPLDSLDADGVERVNGLLVEHVRRRGSVLMTSHVKLATSLLHPMEIDLDAYA